MTLIGVRVHAPEPAWLGRGRNGDETEVQTDRDRLRRVRGLCCDRLWGRRGPGEIWLPSTDAKIVELSQLFWGSGCPDTADARATRILAAGEEHSLGCDRVRTLSGRGALVRIDACSGRVQRIFRLPVNPYQLAFGFRSLWV